MSKLKVHDQITILTDLGFVHSSKLSLIELLRGKPAQPCVTNYSVFAENAAPSGVTAITTEGEIYRREQALSETELARITSRGFLDTSFEI